MADPKSQNQNNTYNTPRIDAIKFVLTRIKKCRNITFVLFLVYNSISWLNFQTIKRYFTMLLEASRTFAPLELKSGLTIKNRIVKAAMEENMADTHLLPDWSLCALYRQWSKGGAGLIITGNVMVDRLAMTGPGGLVLDSDDSISAYSMLAKSGKVAGNPFIMQINHPGRQVFKRLGIPSYSASDVELDLGKHSKLFSRPLSMTTDQIEGVIAKFVNTAKLAKKTGFDGVQIHAAHGYLLSQFLSPITNKREDEWGGSLVNRARLLLSIVSEIKQSCGDKFSLSVKLNSADFQRGGFDYYDAIRVVKMLDDFNLDFIELSGGSYESPAMQGNNIDKSKLKREAYFLEFANKIARSSTTTIMTTGGIRRLAVVEEVLRNHIGLVGIASAIACVPDLPIKWKSDPEFVVKIPKVKWRNKTMAGVASMAMMRRQLQRIGKQKKPLLKPSPFFSFVKDQVRLARLTKRYRKFVQPFLTAQ